MFKGYETKCLLLSVCLSNKLSQITSSQYLKLQLKSFISIFFTSASFRHWTLHCSAAASRNVVHFSLCQLLASFIQVSITDSRFRIIPRLPLYFKKAEKFKFTLCTEEQKPKSRSGLCRSRMILPSCCPSIWIPSPQYQLSLRMSGTGGTIHHLLAWVCHRL